MSDTLATPDDDPNGVYIRLSAQRALLGNVGPHVQILFVAYNGKGVRFVAVVDDELSDGEREALSVAATEIIADYPAGWGLDEEVVAGSTKVDGWCVYERFQAHIYREHHD